MATTEKEIEQALVKIVERHGGQCLKWVCPGRAGVPDRICFMPCGRVYLVETKRPKGGVLSERQKWWRNKFFRLGFFWALVSTVDQLADFEHLLILEEKET